MLNLNKKQKDRLNMSLVEDRFFESRSLALIGRQSLVSAIAWFIIIYPILVAVNSTTKKPLWQFIFHWTLEQGKAFEDGVFAVVWKGSIVLTLMFLGFLLHNNYMESRVFAKRKLYDEVRAIKRTAALNKIYSERFGEQESRLKEQYIVVSAEQNLPDKLIEETFKQKGI